MTNFQLPMKAGWQALVIAVRQIKAGSKDDSKVPLALRGLYPHFRSCFDAPNDGDSPLRARLFRCG